MALLLLHQMDGGVIYTRKFQITSKMVVRELPQALRPAALEGGRMSNDVYAQDLPIWKEPIESMHILPIHSGAVSSASIHV